MNKNYCLYCMSELDAEGRCPRCGEPPKIESEFHQLPAGSVLAGRYLVGRVLGEGGFGITYIGCDTHLKLKVAIKEYYPKDYASRNTTYSILDVTGRKSDDNFEKGKAKFLREAQTMALMDKQRVIVGVRDHFEENGTAYIVMEYIEGETLAALTEKHGGRLSPGELFPLIEPIFDALTSLHSAGLIHRDISPDNIMIERGSIRLIDLGVARDTTESAMTATITVKQNYAPIEQFQSEGQGPQTDLYALGATLYCCLTGSVPARALDRIINDKIKPISEYGINIPQYQADAIMKALSLKSEDRFATAAEMHDAIYNAPAVMPAAMPAPVPAGKAIGRYTQRVPAAQGAPAPAKSGKSGKPLVDIISGSAALAAAVAALIVVNVTGSKTVPVSNPGSTTASTSAPVSSSDTTAAPDITEPAESVTAAETTTTENTSETTTVTTAGTTTSETTTEPDVPAIRPEDVIGDWLITQWNGVEWKEYSKEHGMDGIERFILYLNEDSLDSVAGNFTVKYDDKIILLDENDENMGYLDFSDDLNTMTLVDRSGLEEDVIVANRIDYGAITQTYLGSYMKSPKLSDINCEWNSSEYSFVVDSFGTMMRYEPGETSFMKVVPRNDIYDIFIYDDENKRDINIGYAMCDKEGGKVLLHLIYTEEPTIFKKGDEPVKPPYYGEWTVKDSSRDTGRKLVISDYFVSEFEGDIEKFVYIVFTKQGDDINKIFRIYVNNTVSKDNSMTGEYDAGTETVVMRSSFDDSEIVLVRSDLSNS